MGFFSDIFFGKQVTVFDKTLGELRTRIKREDLSVNYTWIGENLITGQRKKTVFILEGNYLGPHKNQLKSVHRIIDNLQEIIRTADQKIQNQKSNYNRNWSKDFHLAAITPIPEHANQFEVTFEPLNDERVEYVSIVWENDQITEIVAK